MDKNDNVFFFIMNVSVPVERELRHGLRFDSNYGVVHRLDWHIEVDRIQ